MSRSILSHSWRELPYPFVIEAESKFDNEFFVIKDILDYGDALATIIRHRLTYYDYAQLIIINKAFSDRTTVIKNLENFLNSTSRHQYEGITVHTNAIEGISPLNELEELVKTRLSE